MCLTSSCFSFDGPTTRIAPGVGDRFGDLFEEVLILGGAVAGALLAAPVLADGTLGVDDDLVGVFGAEMKNAG
jgi:hypothetical protein